VATTKVLHPQYGAIVLAPNQLREGSMAHNSGPEEAIKGVVEGAKGKAKEAVGTVTGRDDLVREGRPSRTRTGSTAIS
jgi:hypothetical protein